ncbi:MAG: D-alanine--D-alanine ligase [Lutibacter sp.]|uniref:D-alanine--D-alanine ligase n=1 Tax=Lutibacter sp. TaxID=1925666 RepID=UPI00179F8564|nr:D-alanine--D-alanine ligase [Lutibacter sp.]MBT8317488.1 D-alanine--D-alanine ligase [Lutibacter sp.]NNJ58347.1 D-alanine--D-alanine ligase [Lutibacter sp.]
MKKNIAIIMGGYSSEVDISLKSGEVVYQNISKELYNTYKVHILKDKWVLVNDDNIEFVINKHDFSAKIDGQKINFDCVFNAIHGHPGEDGTILAYFDLIGLKHTSAPFYEMAVTFNKRDTLSIVKQYGIKTATSYYLDKGETIYIEKIIKKVGLPCFVKPNNAGSSFGISKAKTKEDIIPAIEKAFKEDSQILIEEFLDGPEITIGVINYNNEIKVLPMTEIVTDNDFFDYEAKYLGKSQEITPARISDEIHQKLERIAKKVYKILNLSGFSRAEYILVNDEPYFLEINMVPGLTNASLIPQQAAEAGISLQELFHNAIKMALKN